ncbi:MAG TPA: hypothetical protein VL859_13175 [Flavobacterium sp.]|nr:hypothetical protein [Flavobacterium sp.]
METIDENKVSPINLAWFNFLEFFFEGQSQISYEQNENGYVTYILENVLNTSITLSNKYGFASLIFSDSDSFQEFVQILKTSYKDLNSDDKQGVFPKKYFPSRIYQANKLTISFYDRSNKFSDKFKFDERTIVFQNILDIIIQLKAMRGKSKFSNDLE